MSALSLTVEMRGPVLSSDHSGITQEADTYRLAVGSPLSLLTFFAAAKKVSAAPHRGNANKPEAKQGKANAPGTTTRYKPPQATFRTRTKKAKSAPSKNPMRFKQNSKNNNRKKRKPREGPQASSF
jgi:hypothetical protein